MSQAAKASILNDIQAAARPVSETIASKVAPSRVALRLDQIQQVLPILRPWTEPADQRLTRWMRNQPSMGVRDRTELRDLVFDLIRNKRLYAYYASYSPAPRDRSLAILALLSQSDAIALKNQLSVVEWDWAAGFSQLDTATLPYAVRHSLPDWLATILERQTQAEDLGQALRTSASFDIRVNPLKVSRNTMLTTLREGPGRGLSMEATPYSPWGIRLDGRPAVTEWSQYKNGEIEIQDEGSQILAALVAPRRGDSIIDYCAGGGGKTLLLGALLRNTGRLYAFDVSAARLERARQRFRRSGLRDVVTMVIDAEQDERVGRLHGKVQKVLVDAPCSGTGTLRRNPDIKWRPRGAEALADYTRLQARILQQASACVAPGGRLIYATCSLLPHENHAQVQAFLASNSDFRLLDAARILKTHCKHLESSEGFLLLRPDIHRTDGFFAAVLEKCQN